MHRLHVVAVALVHKRCTCCTLLPSPSCMSFMQHELHTLLINAVAFVHDLHVLHVVAVALKHELHLAAVALVHELHQTVPLVHERTPLHLLSLIFSLMDGECNLAGEFPWEPGMPIRPGDGGETAIRRWLFRCSVCRGN